MKKLSTTQQGVLDILAEQHQGSLVRLPGGFWTYPGCKLRADTVPTWWVDVRTVRSMERQGILERTNEYQEEWRDTRRLVL